MKSIITDESSVILAKKMLDAIGSVSPEQLASAALILVKLACYTRNPELYHDELSKLNDIK